MRVPPVTVSRRALLLATPVLAVAACRDRAPSRPDPDAAAIAAARDTERRLIDGYDAAGAAGVADVHRAHLVALGDATPSPSPAPAPAPASDPQLLVRSSVAALQRAAIGAHSGQVAATLASIAASHSAGR